MPARIFNENRIGQRHMSAPHCAPKHGRIGLRAPIAAAVLHIFNGYNALKKLVDTQFRKHRVRVNGRPVRQHDLPPRKPANHPREAAFGANHGTQVGERMHDMQKIGGIDGMMAHQPEQRSAVPLRITGPQPVSFIYIDTQPVDDVLRHPAIDRRKNLMRRMMQGVVEIE